MIFRERDIKAMASAGPDALRKLVESMTLSLSSREAEIVRYRAGLADGHFHTLVETGERFGITPNRVRQIEAKGLRKI